MLNVLHRLHLGHKPNTARWLPDSSGLLIGTHTGLTMFCAGGLAIYGGEAERIGPKVRRTLFLPHLLFCND